MRIRLVALVLAVLAAGCDASPETPASRAAVPTGTSSVQTAAPFHPSFRELSDAVPLAADLYPWKVKQRCLTAKATCGLWHHGGHGAQLFASGKPDHGVSESLLIAVMRWPSPEAARRELTRMRLREEQRYTGRFLRPPVGTRRRYSIGETGHGELADAVAGAWSGFRRSAGFRYLLLPHGRRTRVGTWVSAVMVRDSYTLHVQATRWPPGRADDTVDEQLAKLVAALDQPMG